MASLSLGACGTVSMLALNQISLTQFSVENDRLYILGTLNSKSLGQFEQIMSKNPRIKTLVLTACDGSIDDETTFKFGREIRQRGLSTYLLHNSVIASGAVDLFLSGVDRTIEQGAKLGVHSWSDGSIEAKDLPKNHPDHHLNADYINDMLGSDQFYWFTIYAADADTVAWMSEQEIKLYSLATSFLPASQQTTPFNEAFIAYRKEILQSVLVAE